MNADGTVYYLLSDQLGQTSVTVKASNGRTSEPGYEAWGSIHYPTDGHNPGPTDHTHAARY